MLDKILDMMEEKEFLKRVGCAVSMTVLEGIIGVIDVFTIALAVAGGLELYHWFNQ